MFFHSFIGRVLCVLNIYCVVVSTRYISRIIDRFGWHQYPMSGAKSLSKTMRPKIFHRDRVPSGRPLFSFSLPFISTISNDVRALGQELYTALSELPQTVFQILPSATKFSREPVLVPIQTRMRPSNAKRNYYG